MKIKITILSVIVITSFGCATGRVVLMKHQKTGEIRECKDSHPHESSAISEDKYIRKCKESYQKAGYQEVK